MIDTLDCFGAYATADLPAAGLWDAASGVTLIAGGGRSGLAGDNCAEFSTSLGSVLTRTLTPPSAAVDIVTFGHAFRSLTIGASTTLAIFRTSTSVFTVLLLSTGVLQIRQAVGGDLGVVCETPAGTIPLATGGCFYEVKFILTPNDVTSVQIRVSDPYGTMQLVAQGAFLAWDPAPEIPASFSLGGGVGEASAVWRVADFYMTNGIPAASAVISPEGAAILNDGFLGNVHVQALLATGDGANQAVGNTPWVPNAGSEVFSRINEVPPDGDTSYASAVQADQMSTCVFTAPQGTQYAKIGCSGSAPIYGLQWLGRLRAEGTAGTVSAIIRWLITGEFSGDLVEAGADIAVSDTAYRYYPQVFDRNPTLQDEPWTFAVFNGAGTGVPRTTEFGIRNLSGGAPTPSPVVYVGLGDDLQAAIDAVTEPCEIRCEPGTYTGNFILRNNPSIPDGSFVTIRPDVPDVDITPTANPWITPSFAGSLVKLAAADTLLPALTADDAAHGWCLLGVEFPPNTVHPERTLCILGRDNATQAADQPNHITFDCCYFHGHAVTYGLRGLRFDVRNGIVTRSYFEKFLQVGQDAQAIAVVNGPGPFTMTDNYVEAAGENILFGGGDPTIPNMIPSDIIIRGNYVFKPLAWQAIPGSVKNLFELKNAQRVLIENNVFENCWVDAQSGHGIVFTVRNQDGAAPWSVVKDVTFQYNVIKNVEGSGVNMLGKDDINTSAQGTDMVIDNNLWVDVANGCIINNGYEPTTLTHNTYPTLSARWMQLTGTPLPPGNLTAQNNVIAGSDYGIVGDATAPGVPSLTAFAPGSTVNYNVIEAGPSPVTFPAGNTVLTAGTLAALLNSVDTYLGPEAPLGTPPMGADIPAIQARIPWATW